MIARLFSSLGQLPFFPKNQICFLSLPPRGLSEALQFSLNVLVYCLSFADEKDDEMQKVG